MIISASYKTDIPAFYAAWFLRRLDAGFCRSVNPWGGQVYEVPLTTETVDGFVLWTRNIRPLAPNLARVAAVAPYVVQFTVTGYPRSLEVSTVPAEQAIADLRDLRRRAGPRAAVWRYDPVLFTSATPADWHRRNFAALARSLAGTVDEVVVSFAHIYRKTRRNLEAAAAQSGLTWRDPPDDEKAALAAGLAEIAADHGMAFRICAQAALVPPGGALARCIDADRLSAVAGRPIAAPVKGNREDCLCHRSRDIGAYDTCPHGCVYCYAVTTPATAKRRYAAHDPEGAFLFAPAAGPQRSSARRMPENIHR